MQSIKNVVVYLGSKSGNNPIFFETANLLGTQLANNKYNIIYGGANVGTMKALANSAIDAGGNVIGVFPDNFKGKKENRDRGIEVKHSHLTQMIIVKDMQERKKIMEQMSDCCIILPGSFGTLDELFEYAVNRQLGYHSKPIIIININGYYNPMKELINNMAENGFIPRNEISLLTYCNTVDEVIDMLKKYSN
ncbi:MAG: TIGR00730 family Rossman fold protein [Bacteroidales bacterium]